ncbi:hypothetical protein EIZ46_08300 [Chryseobacterium lacus]|nr:hypothetical protein EIZ46_08300 [Chryseobacterium lacus]
MGRWGDGERGRWREGETGRWGERKLLGRCLLLSVSDSGSPVAEALEATEGRFVTEPIIKNHAVGGHLTSDSLVLQRAL